MAKKEDPIIKVAEEARDYIASTAEEKLKPRQTKNSY